MGLALLPALLAGGVASASPYSDAVLADSPLAYWRLGDAGPTAADSGGAGHDGTGGPGVSFAEPSLLLGDPGDLAVRTGTDRIVVPGFEKFGASATGYSVEFWLELSAPADGSFHGLVGDGEGATDFYLMVYLTPTGAIRPHFRGAGVVSFDSIATLSPGSTHHVVTTWDQASGLGSIYIDGALDRSVGVGSGAPLDTANPVFIGRDDREPGFDVFLDEAAIYDYALAPGRILAHHGLGQVPEPGSFGLLLAGLAALARIRPAAAPR